MTASQEHRSTILHITDSMAMSGGIKQLLLLMKGIRKLGPDGKNPLPTGAQEHRSTGAQFFAKQALVCQPDSAIIKDFKEAGFPVYTARMFQDYDIPAAIRLKEIISAAKADIVHAHHPKAHALALITRHFIDFHLIVSRRVTHSIPWYPTSTWKYRNSKIDRYVCVSNSVASVLKRAGVRSDKISVVESSTDLDRFKPCAPPQTITDEFKRKGFDVTGKQVFGMIANYSQWKGHDIFLEACAKLRQNRAANDFVAVLAGRDTDTPALKNRIRDLGIDDNTCLLGWRNDAERLLSVFNALICPSNSGEGLSGAIREAFAMKIPVIASSIPPNIELLGDGGNLRGWLFNAKSASSLADTLSEFSRLSKNIKDDIAQKAYVFTAENYSKDAMVTKTADIYSGFKKAARPTQERAARVCTQADNNNAAFNSAENKKILVIQLKRLGDVLLTTPALAHLRKRFPKARIDFLSYKGFASAINNNPDVDSIIRYPKQSKFRMLGAIRKIRAIRYDLVVDFMASGASAWICLLSGAKIKASLGSKYPKWIHNIRINESDIPSYMAETKISFLDALFESLSKNNGRYQRGAHKDLRILPKICVKNERIAYWKDAFSFSKYDRSPLIAISAASRRSTRRWHARGFAQVAQMLAEKLKAKVVFLWGPGEREYTRDIVDMAHNENVILAPRLVDFHDLGSFISNTDLLITNCNGTKHVAIGVDTATLTIHTSSDPAVWNPAQHDSHRFICAQHLPCIGCRKNTCPFSMQCASMLDPQAVFDEAVSMLAAAAAKVDMAKT
ncbi:glycosyltransferase [Elusimicrobiota bacterium]